jgi:hypothetical protein
MMSKAPGFGWPDLQLDEHYMAQRRGWIADRVGWAIMFLVILAALAGFFGNGFLGLRDARDSTGLLEVEYNEFGRAGADSTLTVQVSERAASQDEIGVWLPNEYLDAVRIDDIRPAPDRSEAHANGVLFTFLTTEGDLEAQFDLTGDKVGSVHGLVGLGGPQGAVGIDQFFYP